MVATAFSPGHICNTNVDREAAPLAQRIALAQADVRDLDGRIAQLDAMVNAATGRDYTKTAMALVGRQTTSRAALVAERQQPAERLAQLEGAASQCGCTAGPL